MTSRRRAGFGGARRLLGRSLAADDAQEGTMYALITLKDGTQAISEFTKLRSLGKYAADVFSGRKAFNVWTVTATVHPTSGAPAVIRTRKLIAGSDIRSMEEVRPIDPMHGYIPNNFAPVEHVMKGPHGLWTCPQEDPPAGGVPGVEYPVDRDEYGRRFVILRDLADTQAGGEIKHYIDPQPVASGWTPEDEEDDDTWGDDDHES